MDVLYAIIGCTEGLGILAIFLYSFVVCEESDGNRLTKYNFLVIFYKYIYEFLRDYLNKAGTIIALVVLQAITLLGTIIAMASCYCFVLPIILIVQLFCKIFRNKEEVKPLHEINEDIIDI